MLLKRTFVIAAASMVGTIASSAIPRRATARYADIMGCEVTCPVAAGGWPFAYVVDYPGLSPSGSADVLGYLLGVDRLLHGSLAATFLCWLLFFAVLLLWYAHVEKSLKR